MAYRFNSDSHPNYCLSLYHKDYFILIRDYARRHNCKFPVTNENPPDALNDDQLDVWYIYKAWLSRKRGEWYKTSVRRVIGVAKQRLEQRKNDTYL